jgi:hypothetical protein
MATVDSLACKKNQRMKKSPAEIIIDILRQFFSISC